MIDLLLEPQAEFVHHRGSAGYFVIEHAGAALWRGYAHCVQHAMQRMSLTLGDAQPRDLSILGPLMPDHPKRRAAAS